MSTQKTFYQYALLAALVAAAATAFLALAHAFRMNMHFFW